MLISLLFTHITRFRIGFRRICAGQKPKTPAELLEHRHVCFFLISLLGAAHMQSWDRSMFTTFIYIIIFLITHFAWKLKILPSLLHFSEKYLPIWWIQLLVSPSQLLTNTFYWFPKNKLQHRLVWPQNMFQLSFGPSDMGQKTCSCIQWFPPIFFCSALKSPSVISQY